VDGAWACIDDDARTLYRGYVETEPLVLTTIKERLGAAGCFGDEATNLGLCRFRETTNPFDGRESIEVYPHGLGFGPLSIHLTGDRLWAEKDIVGSQDIEKFKTAIRKDVVDIGGVVTVLESSWMLIEARYPWTVVY